MRAWVWVRRLLFLGLVLFPAAVWGVARAWGHPVATWNLPGIPRPDSLFVLWAFAWMVVALALGLAGEGEGEATGRDVGRSWGLALLVDGLGSGYLAGVMWGVVVIGRALERRWPWLTHVDQPLFLALTLGLLIGPLLALAWLRDHLPGR